MLLTGMNKPRVWGVSLDVSNTHNCGVVCGKRDTGPTTFSGMAVDLLSVVESEWRLVIELRHTC